MDISFSLNNELNEMNYSVGEERIKSVRCTLKSKHPKSTNFYFILFLIFWFLYFHILFVYSLNHFFQRLFLNWSCMYISSTSTIMNHAALKPVLYLITCYIIETADMAWFGKNQFKTNLSRDSFVYVQMD